MTLGTIQLCTETEPTEARMVVKKELSRSFSLCKELGMDCSFQTTGTTSLEVMKKFIEHAGSAHHMDVLTADVIYRIQKALQK